MAENQHEERRPLARILEDRSRADRQRRVVAAIEAGYVAQLSSAWDVPKPARATS